MSRSLAQHLRDALRSFEELLRGTDIDYYLGQGFREQLAQGRHLAERLSDKLGTCKCPGGHWVVWRHRGMGRDDPTGAAVSWNHLDMGAICPALACSAWAVWGQAAQVLRDTNQSLSGWFFFFFRGSTGWGG